MYARGMSQRDIAETIEDIYGFEISHETVSQITDCILDKLDDWQNRPLKRMYTFLFVDCMYVTIKKEYESKNYAVYTILGYDLDGQKDILDLWLNKSESKHTWMQIFDELKTRGVEDVLFIQDPFPATRSDNSVPAERYTAAWPPGQSATRPPASESSAPLSLSPCPLPLPFCADIPYHYNANRAN